VVNQVLVVSILMIVQGALELILGSILLLAAFIVPTVIDAAERRGGVGFGPFPRELTTFLTVVYIVIGLAGLIAAVLHLIAGIQGLRFRGRVFGITALIAGGISMATIYCAPTTIGLMIWGLIVYFNADVRKAFDFAAQGMSPTEIRASFARRDDRWRREVEEPWDGSRG
jgi:hypothetical protein